MKANKITWLIMYTKPTYNKYFILRKYKYNFEKLKYKLHSIFQVNLTHKFYHMPKYFYLQVAHDVILLFCC